MLILMYQVKDLVAVIRRLVIESRKKLIILNKVSKIKKVEILKKIFNNIDFNYNHYYHYYYYFNSSKNKMPMIQNNKNCQLKNLTQKKKIP